MGLTGSEAWRGKRERVPGGRGASRRRGPGEKVRKRRGSAGQSAGRCCLSVWKAASDYHELKGRAQGLRVRESRAASGESGIVKQRGPRVAPESWEGGILEVEAGVRSRGYSRLVVRAVRFRLGVGQWNCVGDLGWSFRQSWPHWVESDYLPLYKNRCLLGQGRSQHGLGSEAASGR